MPKLSEITDFDMWANELVSLSELAQDGPVMSPYVFGCEHKWSRTISEDNQFFHICRACCRVTATEADDDAYIVSTDGPTESDVVAVKLLLV